MLCKPILVWGEQGCGKTTFSQFLALLRILFFQHTVSVSDPHAHQNNWCELFDVYGYEYNYGAINKRLVAYYDRLKNGNIPHTSIWDEMTNYQENCDEKLAGRFLKSILSDVRKPPEYPILLAHNNTLSCLAGGQGGIKATQDKGMVEVYLMANREKLGGLVPALRGTVKGLTKDELGNPITIPIQTETWMTPQYLLQEFPSLIGGALSLSKGREELKPETVELSESNEGINLNKVFPDLSTEQAKLLTYLVRKSEELDTIEFRLSTIMNGNVINLEKFPWDESILVAERKPRLAYYICLRAIESAGYLKIIEDEKGVMIRLE